MSRSRRQVSQTRVSPVSIILCGCAIAVAASLFTPYPADLVRALRGMPSETSANPGTTDNTRSLQSDKTDKDTEQPTQPDNGIAKGKATDSASTTGETPPPPVTPVTPPVVSAHMVDSRLAEPWRIERSVSMPDVSYPPFPPVIPTRVATGAFWDVKELARGLNLKTKVNFIEGDRASITRVNPANYRATITLDVVVPKPLTKAEELNTVNPNLSRMLPGLKELFDSGKLSPYYSLLYTRKQNEIRKKLSSLNQVLDRHNFYDTETIMELRHPATGRKVLWLQSEMDVVSDGSDGDRLSTMPDKILNSSFYQPSTSYRWIKKTDKVNPLLPVWEKRLASLQTTLAKATGEKKAQTRNEIEHAKLVIAELKRNSFLIAEYDPFIVVPLGIVNQSSTFSPSFGDFVVVVAGNKLYPAIVGDAGPRYKTGEASLRLAATINSKANSYARPVSDLTVSYIIFPGTALPDKGPPDYGVWESTCMGLLNDIGGLAPGYTLHRWTDLLAPPPPVDTTQQAGTPNTTGATATSNPPGAGKPDTLTPATGETSTQKEKPSSSGAAPRSAPPSSWTPPPSSRPISRQGP